MTIRIFAIVALCLSVASSVGACGGTTAPSGAMAAVTRPATLDTATTRPTDQGLFQVSYTSAIQPPTINTVHTWTVHVATAGGQPVEGAQVTVTGGMPEHNHGMPTAPQVTAIANGDYRVEGMKFQMPGWWTVTVHVEAGGKQDSATFNLVLQ
jgi:hypothetical protein